MNVEYTNREEVPLVPGETFRYKYRSEDTFLLARSPAGQLYQVNLRTGGAAMLDNNNWESLVRRVVSKVVVEDKA